MQESKEKFSFVSLLNGVLSENPVLSRGLLDPYQQQKHDINLMLQNNMTIELHKQLMLLEQRSNFCMRLKNHALEEATRKSGEMEIRLRKALAEAEFWKREAEQKNKLSNTLAKRLMKVEKREFLRKTIPGKEPVEDAESSIGENEGDDVDTARTRRCKRRRL